MPHEEVAKPIQDFAKKSDKKSLEGQEYRVFQSRVMGNSLPPKEEVDLRDENYTPTPKSHKGQEDVVWRAKVKRLWDKHIRKISG